MKIKTSKEAIDLAKWNGYFAYLYTKIKLQQ